MIRYSKHSCELTIRIGKAGLYLHLKPLRGCRHGKASEYWPWWKLIGWLYCSRGAMAKGGMSPPSTARRFWIYFRWIGGVYADLVIDRRKTLLR